MKVKLLTDIHAKENRTPPRSSHNFKVPPSQALALAAVKWGKTAQQVRMFELQENEEVTLGNLDTTELSCQEDSAAV